MTDGTTVGRPNGRRDVQFVALRRRGERAERMRVGRMAREAGLDGLATAVEEQRYHGLLERYRAGNRSDEANE